MCDNHDGLLCTSKPECPHCSSAEIEQTAFGSARRTTPGNDIAALHRNQAICLCESCGKTFYLVLSAEEADAGGQQNPGGG